MEGVEEESARTPSRETRMIEMKELHIPGVYFDNRREDVVPVFIDFQFESLRDNLTQEKRKSCH